ncbi:hypothetical protein [Planosporangium mesophilum]|uniref:Uncharacterized protein n=1 Tax=Planosporangium mesophilum TaxID=689768 RepID=A0A8J3WZ11_9ACTN|nr:hypothetical protein [Planosporangium mesophilum]NJC83378.1 hypothetical protein [Planosporangium mesophilum]GII21757.1 hypothetical protein Pme01_13540 [Planosporangium mesophilum]
MTYEQLAQHAAEIERSAIEESLKQRGFMKDRSGNWRDPNLDDETVRAALAVTVSRYQGVAGMFTPFLGMPDPAKFKPMIGYLKTAMRALSSGQPGNDPVYKADVPANDDLQGMTTVGRAVQDWRGVAAVAFRQNFVEPFPAITTNQFAVVATLKGAIDAEQALWGAARDSVDQIAHKAQAALDVMNDCNPKDQTALLTVASSVFAVAAGVTTGGAAIALTVAGAAAQVGSGIPREEPKKVEFSGKTPDAIIGQVQAALNILVADIDTKELAIAGAVSASASCIAGNRDRFISARPSLADADARTVTGPRGLGESI